MKPAALAIAFLLAALLLTSCGGSSDDAPSPSRSEPTETEPPPEPATDPVPDPQPAPPDPAEPAPPPPPDPNPEPAPAQEEPPPPNDPQDPAPPDEPEPDPTPEPQPFPDDVILAYQLGGEVWVATAAGETHQVTFDFHARPNDWSPDGTQLLVTARPDGLDGTEDLYLLDGLGTEPIHILATPNWRYGGSFSPDGNHIAFNDLSSTINFLSLDGSPPPPAIELDDRAAMFGFQYLRWSPDGSRFVFALLPELEWRDIYVIDVDGTGLTRLRPPDDFQFGEYRFVEIEPEWSPRRHPDRLRERSPTSHSHSPSRSGS